MHFGETGHNGIDKVSRYGWTLKDEPGEMRMINKHDIHVDHEYQRDPTLSRVAKITAAWSWVACAALVVARRSDGTLWAIDGQHRLLAAKRRGDISQLPCIVFQATDVSTEARGFLDNNGEHKAVTSVQIHKALVAVGDDVAVYVDQVLAELGLTITKSHSNKNGLTCVTMMKRFAAIDKQRFHRVMQVATTICRNAEIRINARLLEGLWYVHSQISALNDQRFVERLNSIDGRVLLDCIIRAVSLNGHGHAKLYGGAIVQEVNKGLRNKFTLEKGGG